MAATLLYIFWFLHQTTTATVAPPCSICCISFDSYIKPQPSSRCRLIGRCCISFDSYIKPQLLAVFSITAGGCISFDSYIKPQLIFTNNVLNIVVYLLIPTSNHNWSAVCLAALLLYIFWFLHQTTTMDLLFDNFGCCISFDSYIKPQLGHFEDENQKVVYLLIPTSNHNYPFAVASKVRLYIFWFLHQTTTQHLIPYLSACCISFDSYIKPQPIDLNILIFST